MPRRSSSTSFASTSRCANGSVFDVEPVEERPGILTFRVVGKGARRAFRNEPGGHRWQRQPANDKRGRIHTSTVTVAVMREPEPSEFHVDERDLTWTTMRGSGAGGQKRNKTESAVCVVHGPSGLSVRCETERSQYQNKATALALLGARLLAAKEFADEARTASARKGQVGSGMRGDKVRTYRVHDGIVTDHRTDRKAALRDVLRGDLSGLG